MKKLLIILIVLLVAWPCWGATYTVCSSGCDYTTIQGVFDGEDLASSDIVEVRADTVGGSKTYSEKVTWGANDDGDATGNVILQGRSGDAVTIDGTDNGITGTVDYITIKDILVTSCTSIGVYLSGGSYITIDNVNSSSNSGHGIRLTDVNGAIEIKNCTTNSNTGSSGVVVTGSAINATSVSIHDNTSNLNGLYGFDVEQQENCTISIYNNTSNSNGWGAVLFEDNEATCTQEIYDNSFSSNCTVHSGATIWAEDCPGIKIYRNLILDSGYYGIDITTDAAGDVGADNPEIYSNIVDSTYWDGIIVRLINAGCDSITGLKICNNTVTNCGTGNIGRAGIIIYRAAGAETVSGDVKNNIVFEPRLRYAFINCAGTLNFDNNCYYKAGGDEWYWGAVYNTLADWRTASGGDANAFINDPLFVDATNDNFTLQAGSLCIDTGTSNGSTPYSSAIKDLNKRTITDASGDCLDRFGGRLDMGCYEYVGDCDTLISVNDTTYSNLSIDATGTYIYGLEVTGEGNTISGTVTGGTVVVYGDDNNLEHMIIN